MLVNFTIRIVSVIYLLTYQIFLMKRMEELFIKEEDIKIVLNPGKTPIKILYDGFNYCKLELTQSVEPSMVLHIGVWVLLSKL